jgi:DHA1 family tetracycline resistance protein-like MFS transporter
MKSHSLITALRNLRGNPRGCVYPEPLWGIPFHLYAPYASIYMVALGLADREIGLILSISWAFQIVLALLGGAVTDKLGRRRTTLIFDILSWAIPALISAAAQNFWYFLAAGIVNSVWRITQNSWTCLLVEDAEPDQLADIYTWIYICNLLVGFLAPVAGVLIRRFSLVPTLRGLYVFAAFMFTLKAFVTYWSTEETAQGKVRLQETRDRSVRDILRGYRGVFRTLLHTPQTLYTAGIMLVISVSSLISGTFWSIIVTEKLHVPAEGIAIFPPIRSAIMLGFFFAVMPRLRRMHFTVPTAAGFLAYAASQVVLLSTPELGYPSLILSVFLEACSFAAVGPLVDKMTALTIDARERARIQSILYVLIILFTSPFGLIAGVLSEIDKGLPFVLNAVLLAFGAALAYVAGSRQSPAADAEGVGLQESPATHLDQERRAEVGRRRTDPERSADC